MEALMLLSSVCRARDRFSGAFCALSCQHNWCVLHLLVDEYCEENRCALTRAVRSELFAPFFRTSRSLFATLGGAHPLSG